jgi:beta-lactamase superfamily II metal-dependent hydrolase
MSVIKSFSVGNGDMFYIEHNSDNFTIIDCCVTDDNSDAILGEISSLSAKKGITRFISTHPDDDHISGLELLDAKIGIRNFYCVENDTTKPDETDCFNKYCELRSDAGKVFHIAKGCTRRWMNQGDKDRDASGISVLWPDTDNEHFKEALEDAVAGGSPNNISAVIKYALAKGVTALWMGDLETDFMECIEEALDVSAVDILFAPHHGRDSGRIPESILAKLSPKIVVIGEAPSEHLNYYEGYNTITQNSAGDIVFDCVGTKVHVFSTEEYYVDFLDDEACERANHHYVGTLNLASD